MLEKLELADISLKMVKCLWFANELPFLGHTVVAGQGVTVNKKKVMDSRAGRHG